MKIRMKESWKPFLLVFSLLTILLIALPIGAEEEEPLPANSYGPAASPQALLYTGAASHGVPIVVPPGRAGIAPNLSLGYNSYQKNGWIGVGWNLGVGAIKRSTKRGVDYGANDFVHDSSELVPDGNLEDCGAGEYRAKIEGAFSKYHFDCEEGWEVTTKDGTKYYYGRTTASRQDNEHGVFKWCLDKVEDTNGNYMTITYTKDQAEIYLDRIDYTGNGSLSTTNYVKFYLEDRTDAPPMYTTNAKVVTAKRLKTIEVYGNGVLARKYELDYIYSESAGRSLLSSVTQYGSDGVTALPPTSFEWQAGAGGFGTPECWVSDYGYSDSAGEWRVEKHPRMMADVNGDGKGLNGVKSALLNGSIKWGQVCS